MAHRQLYSNSCRALGLLLAAAVCGTPAAAHPHVWVNVKMTVLYEGGKLAGFQHHWTFDDMYTAMAVQGLDKNSDGAYSREELAELAQVNIDGLKEFAYFTEAKLGNDVLKTAPPKDYWLEHKDGILTLHFTLPLQDAVLADAEGFNFSVYDPSFFIAFDLMKEEPVKLSSGAPEGCSVQVGGPQNDLKALQDAFGSALTAGDANMGTGFGYASSISVVCKKT